MSKTRTSNAIQILGFIRNFQFNPTYGMMQFFLLFHFTRIAIRIYYGSSIKTFYRDLLSHSLAIRLIPHYPLG